MLQSLGLVFQLGHSRGHCIAPACTPSIMTVLHTDGAHQVLYQYCGCNVSDSENKWQQLMQNGWYPVMILQPVTCATFECLDTFCLLQVITAVDGP